MTLADTLLSLRTVLHLFPLAESAKTKEQGTSPDLHFGVFGQLQGPGGAPRGLSAGLESESDPEIKAEQ